MTENLKQLQTQFCIHTVVHWFHLDALRDRHSYIACLVNFKSQQAANKKYRQNGKVHSSLK